MTHATEDTDVAPGTALTFFNEDEARTLAAVVDRIVPGSADNPSASQAGVVVYIDRAVAGFSAELQPTYRLGLRELERLAASRHGLAFEELTDEQQDALITLLIGPSLSDPDDGLQFGPPDQAQTGTTDSVDTTTKVDASTDIDLALAHRVMAVVREHAVEGYFCDPVYGGNRNAAGWRLVGFPGAQWGYTARQMTPGFDARTIPIKTLADLRAELRAGRPNNTVYTTTEQ